MEATDIKAELSNNNKDAIKKKTKRKRKAEMIITMTAIGAASACEIRMIWVTLWRKYNNLRYRRTTRTHKISMHLDGGVCEWNWERKCANFGWLMATETGSDVFYMISFIHQENSILCLLRFVSLSFSCYSIEMVSIAFVLSFVVFCAGCASVAASDETKWSNRVYFEFNFHLKRIICAASIFFLFCTQCATDKFSLNSLCPFGFHRCFSFHISFVQFRVTIFRFASLSICHAGYFYCIQFFIKLIHAVTVRVMLVVAVCWCCSRSQKQICWNLSQSVGKRQCDDWDERLPARYLCLLSTFILTECRNAYLPGCTLWKCTTRCEAAHTKHASEWTFRGLF